MVLSVNDILNKVGGKIVNTEALDKKWEQIRVAKISSLGIAQPSDLAFFFSRAFQSELKTANPGVLILGAPFVEPLKAACLPIWKSTVMISSQDPYMAMAVLSEGFADEQSTVSHLPKKDHSKSNRIHPSAVIANTAQMGTDITVGANCVIEENAVLGSGSVLYPGCYVGPNVVIGENCVLFPNVTLYEMTQIGHRVRIHSSTVVGSDGFGYAPKKSQGKVIGHQKIYHLGRVIIGDDVEIGACVCIDRGTFGDTTIAKNVKIDNLTQVAHNVSIDEGAVICGGNGFAGNASVGKYAYIGGICGVSNHVHVGDGATIAAMTLVSKDVPPGGTALGNPQREYRTHFRAHAVLNKLASQRKSK